MICWNVNGVNIFFFLLYGLFICFEVEFIEMICGLYYILLILNRLLKKIVLLECDIEIDIFFFCYEEIWSVKIESFIMLVFFEYF